MRPFYCQDPFLRPNICLMDYCSHLFLTFSVFRTIFLKHLYNPHQTSPPHSSLSWSTYLESPLEIPNPIAGVIFFSWHQSHYFKAYNRALLPLRHGPWSSLDKSYDKKNRWDEVSQYLVPSKSTDYSFQVSLEISI